MPPHMPPDSDDDDEASSPDEAVINLITRCTELKAAGNAKFKAEALGEAVNLYREAVEKMTSDVAKKALKSFFANNKDSPDTASPLLASLHGNTAACHVKAQQWQSALTASAEALKIEPDNVKARFRHGVAASNLNLYDEAKADLTAVVRADPKNREARTILDVVNAAIKERTNKEKGMFGKAFAANSGLYADEEAKAAKAAKAAADAEAAAEEALLKEWRLECDELRKGQPSNPAIDLICEAARGGDSEARRNLDRLAPISLEEFREAKRKAAAKERARREKEERAREKAVAEAEAKARTARSDVSTLEADEEDEDLLKGMSKGYKLRADGTKTSYFDRSEQVDAATKAMLEAQKAPKKLSGGAADRAAAGRVDAPPAFAPAELASERAASQGSAWNAAGTYEERDVSSWATEDLSSRLSAIRIEVAGGELCVRSVDEMEGSASIISSRGKVKRPFDLKCDVVWRFDDGDPSHACEGVLSYSEIVPSQPDSQWGFEVDQSERFTKAVAKEAMPGVKVARAALQERLNHAIQGFVDALAAK